MIRTLVRRRKQRRASRHPERLVTVHLLYFLFRMSISVLRGSNRKEHTSVSRPSNNARPANVNLVSVTLTSHPASARRTGTPSARDTI